MVGTIRIALHNGDSYPVGWMAGPTPGVWSEFPVDPTIGRVPLKHRTVVHLVTVATPDPPIGRSQWSVGMKVEDRDETRSRHHPFDFGRNSKQVVSIHHVEAKAEDHEVETPIRERQPLGRSTRQINPGKIPATRFERGPGRIDPDRERLRKPLADCFEAPPVARSYLEDRYGFDSSPLEGIQDEIPADSFPKPVFVHSIALEESIGLERQEHVSLGPHSTSQAHYGSRPLSGCGSPGPLRIRTTGDGSSRVVPWVVSINELPAVGIAPDFRSEEPRLHPILHVGYQKTATTWLQKVVLKHHPQLALVLRKTKGAGWLENVIGDHPFAFDPDRIRTAFEDCIQPFPGRLPFLSHEAWIGDPYSGGRNTPENARRLQAIFPEARVVIVLREPIDMIRSIYRQYVQEGGALDCESLLTARYPQRTYFDCNFLNYDEVLDLYAGLFGRDRVCALPFESLVDSPQQFVDELLGFCGVDPLNLDDIRQRRKNRGLSMPSLAIARGFNRVLGSAFNPAPLLPRSLATWRELRRFLQRRVDPRLGEQSWNDVKKPLLTNERVQQLEAHYRPHNERLKSEYGITFTAKNG